MRAAERAQAAKKAAVAPAPRWLTAMVIGIGVVLVFVAIVALSMGAPMIFIGFALPVIAAGALLAFPIGLLLERVSRGWRKGYPEIAFLMVGLAVGAGWTYAGISLFGLVQSSDPGQVSFVRSVAGIFMATATASAFMAAKFWTDGLRMQPRVVYSFAVIIGALALVSAYVLFFSPPV
jgi:hypothetical protein